MSTRQEIIKKAALLAGQAIKDAVPTAGVIEKEGRANMVTAADLVSEKIIMDLIHTHFPTDAILSEETANNLKDIEKIDHLWVIDPLDGTNNFRYQRHNSCVSVGYIEKGIPMLGAVYDPFHAEFFWAEKGHGAWVNDQPMRVSDQTDIHKASVASDNSYDPAGTKRNLELLLKIEPTPWVIVKSCAVLLMCEIACGRTDVYIHTALKPWDNAAAFLLMREAGASVYQFDGTEAPFTSPEVIAGNPILVAQYLEILNT